MTDKNGLSDEVIFLDDEPKTPNRASSGGSKKSIAHCAKPTQEFYIKFFDL